MKSAIAVLTYNRLPVLQEEIKGIYEHCSQYPLAIFDDLSQRDGTGKWLTRFSDEWTRRDDMMADEYFREDGSKVFIGNQSCAMAIALGLGKRVLQETWLENSNCMLDRPDSAIYWKSGASPTIPELWLK